MRRFNPSARRTRLAVGGLAMALLLALAGPANAQLIPPGAGTPKPPPIDTAPLSRYFPKQDLQVYAEFAGLDAHADAWRQTAAYKLLNETTLGVMLEDVVAQLADRALVSSPNRRLNGAEVVTLIKQIAKTGFAVGLAGPLEGKNPTCSALVLRGGARRDNRALFSRLIASFAPATAKSQQIKKPGGRTVVSVTQPGSQGWTWWAEKDDVVVTLAEVGSDSVAAVIAAMDGSQPNAVDHANVVELSRVDGTFRPVGFAFLNAAVFARQPELAGLQRLDYRWGFQADALMSVARVVAPSPRQGFLALLDQPTFDKDSLPPLPAGLAGFTVVSVAPAQVFDRMIALTKQFEPASADRFAAAERVVKEKARIRLREDLLAQLGPKMAFYIAPGPAQSAPAPDASTFLSNPLAAMMALRGAAIPKVTVVAEVTDSAAFGRTLDELINLANREIKDAMAALPAAANPAGADQAGGAVPRPGSRPTIAFLGLPGPNKSYMLNIPPGALPIPLKDFRPTIRLKGKYLAISTSPDAARSASEIKPDAAFAPDPATAPAFAELPGGLVYLALDDPRPAMPQLLAGLPGMIQAMAAQIEAQAAARANPASTAPPAAGAVPAMPGRPGERGSPSGPILSPGAMPGAPGGAPTTSITPPTPGAPAAPLGPLRLRVDRAKLPDPEALRSRMFPGTVALAVDAEGVRLVTRESMPNIGGAGLGTALLLPAVQSARAAARRAQSTNNLKQIGLAIHNFESVRGKFPRPAIVDKQGKPLLSWRVAILPFIEMELLYDKFKLNEPWDSPHNKALLAEMPTTYADPSLSAAEPGSTTYRAFAGKGTFFDPSAELSVKDVTDGLSNTIAVVGATQGVPWTKPEDIAFNPDDKTADAFKGAGWPAPLGTLALFADGSVRPIPPTTAIEALRAMITRAGGEQP